MGCDKRKLTNFGLNLASTVFIDYLLFTGCLANKKKRKNMKKTFVMVCAAIALVSCGGKTAPSAADVVSDTVENTAAQTAGTEAVAADAQAADAAAVTAALDEHLKSGDAKAIGKALSEVKATVAKLQSEGKTEEAAAYASKIKEYVDNNKAAITKAAKGDMTVAGLVTGIANLPASLKQSAADAKNAVNADAGKVASDVNAAENAAKANAAATKAAAKAAGTAAKAKVEQDAAAAKAAAEAAKKAAEAKAAAKVQEGKQKVRDAANKKVNEALNKALGN